VNNGVSVHGDRLWRETRTKGSHDMKTKQTERDCDSLQLAVKRQLSHQN